jgi:uracil-DNA glycosylase
MDADVQNGSGLINTQFDQFTEAVKDFSQYLNQQKKSGNTFLEISEESQSRINNWETIGQAKEPFFFQGPEKSDIFILDSRIDFFRGKSGELLVKILAAMKLTIDSVFICNAGDLKLVNEKIKTVSPKVIITLGTKAGQALLEIRQPLDKFQGRFHEYHGIKVMPTFHPSLLLKYPEYKRKVWDDMQKVMKLSDVQYET